MKIINIILSVSFLLLTSSCSEKSEIENRYESIHCVLGDKNGTDKLELYYDFNDNKVYRFSIVTTKLLTDSIDIETYKRIVTDTNSKQAGYSGKVWHDNEKMITLETYYLELFSEEEFQEALMMSKEELQSKTRKEIIESIVPMGDNVNYSCK